MKVLKYERVYNVDETVPALAKVGIMCLKDKSAFDCPY